MSAHFQKKYLCLLLGQNDNSIEGRPTSWTHFPPCLLIDCKLSFLNCAIFWAANVQNLHKGSKAERSFSGGMFRAVVKEVVFPHCIDALIELGTANKLASFEGTLVQNSDPPSDLRG